MTKNAIVFDIDGVLANNSHRLYLIQGPDKKYTEFYHKVKYDKPYGDIIWLTELLFHANCDIFIEKDDFAMYICTARRQDCEQDTRKWLQTHANRLYYLVNSYGGDMLMRPLKDYRPSADIKSEMIDHIESKGYSIRLWLEDDPDCCSMLKKRGITVLDPKTHEKAEPFG